MDLDGQCNFDNGVIRSPRPVTFLTRAEPTASPCASCRAPARRSAAKPVAAGRSPPPPLRRRRPCAAAIPSSGSGRRQEPRAAAPPPRAFTRHGEYAALRAYEAQELAIRRGDPMWQLAYGRAAMASDSGARPCATKPAGIMAATA